MFSAQEKLTIMVLRFSFISVVTPDRILFTTYPGPRELVPLRPTTGCKLMVGVGEFGAPWAYTR